MYAISRKAQNGLPEAGSQLDGTDLFVLIGAGVLVNVCNPVLQAHCHVGAPTASFK